MIESLGRLSEYLGMPVMASNHGLEIDYMNGLVHWLMLVLFIGWGIFFIYTLIKFRSSKNPEANYIGVTSHANSYVEYGVIIIEAFLLIAFAIPIWANVKTNIPEVKSDTVEVRVIAQQFAWNIHYAGADGKFGESRTELVDEEINPIGLDRNSPYGADDIVTINQLHLPVNKEAMIYLSSKDVIHSFGLPEMRVKQDAIPGMTIPVFFTPTMTTSEFLEKIKGTAREGKGFEIACAQLCGNSHYRMRGFMTIDTEQEFAAFLEEEASYLSEEEDDEEW